MNSDFDAIKGAQVRIVLGVESKARLTVTKEAERENLKEEIAELNAEIKRTRDLAPKVGIPVEKIDKAEREGKAYRGGRGAPWP